MPKVGKEEFAYTPEGIEAAKAKAEETGIPMSNAMERSESYQMGGLVDTPQYKKGGNVKEKEKIAPLSKRDVTDAVALVSEIEKVKKMPRQPGNRALKRAYKKEIEATKKKILGKKKK